MRSFLAFCMENAITDPMTVDETDIIIPVQYRQTLEQIITNVKNKLDRLNSISLSYIQDAMDETTVTDRLSTVGGEVPDSIINRLSRGIFTKDVYELTDVETAVVKVLAVYTVSVTI